MSHPFEPRTLRDKTLHSPKRALVRACEVVVTTFCLNHFVAEIGMCISISSVAHVSSDSAV